MPRFANRVDAGRQLAERLTRYAARPDVLVLGLPRGGVPVAAEVARALQAPLDVYLVRKLGVPEHPELAMGAIAEGGIEVLDEDLVRSLRIPPALVDEVTARERRELDRRERLYRGARPRPAIAGRTVIVVDDGLATGATMDAAVQSLRAHVPAAVIVAAPVGAEETCERLRKRADDVVCVLTPWDLHAVGLWYEDFRETSDDEVRQLIGDGDSSSNPTSSHPGHGSDPAAMVRRHAVRLDRPAADDDGLIAALANARVVLIGEATHGTHEFYRERSLITRRLIADHGFAAVAVEADWPDAYRVNRYVRGIGRDGDATDALADFKRFPAWMWRNADVLDFVGWLREHNESRPSDRRAGFYGLDLYSLHSSMEAVIRFLDKVDPPAAARARSRYGCFDRFGAAVEQYAQATGLGLTPSCEREVVMQLVELRRQAAEYAQRDGRLSPDEYFVAEENARVVRDAEAYYRTMMGGRAESWNLRDRHMAETLENLLKFLGRTGPAARVVVWAHNSHLGDARATDMAAHGELNLGQLAREQYKGDALSVGLTTYTGSVTAALEWHGPALRRHVRPALDGSYEALFHTVGLQRFLLRLHADRDLTTALSHPRLERAIGVLYRPETERHSHYFQARLSRQFDYVIHLDHTRAVEPLERTSAWEAGELAETFPSGL